ncbi:DEAD-box ATP-dependent RNA helicase 7 [Hibiscus syriacus]|uniref:RNA helicase n=1 Tax=Hibiscus syriacus TaxID=106335 RepID=A0A6A2Y500_HIBSY|nr:DEAD-box ATP-dependent RNA helicase 7 [Hibiscus syriacus]
MTMKAMTFNVILNGTDLVGRARTGQGKTLAFVLPILESLTNGPAKASRKTGSGRAPNFEVYGEVSGLTSGCLYGVAPYHTQEMKLKRGVDIVIGTPGRVNVICSRYPLKSSLKFRVLDEADEMLRMGFVDEVELILEMQNTLEGRALALLYLYLYPNLRGDLLSDLLIIATRFLKTSKKTVYLVGNEKMKASTSAGHIVLPCSKSAFSARSQLIPDIIRCYSSGGRTIIFTETKDSASEFSGLLPGSPGFAWRPTAGPTRGRVLSRAYHFSCFCSSKMNPVVSQFLSVIPAFKSVAQELLATSGLSAEDLLAKALAKAAVGFHPHPLDLLILLGYSEIKSRSLLTSMENYVTLLLEAGKPIYTLSFLPEEKVQSVQGLTLTTDGMGAVFDVAEKDVENFLAGAENTAYVILEVMKKESPRLQERDHSRGRLGGGRAAFGDRIDGGGRFSGGRGCRGGFSDRRNDRFPGGGHGRYNSKKL